LYEIPPSGDADKKLIGRTHLDISYYAHKIDLSVKSKETFTEILKIEECPYDT
jgi:hypothetical protein